MLGYMLQLQGQKIRDAIVDKLNGNERYRAENYSLRLEIDSLRQTISSYKERERGLKERADFLEMHNADLYSELSGLSERARDLEKDLKVAREIVEPLQRANVDLREDLNVLILRTKSREASYVLLQKEFDGARTQIEHLSESAEHHGVLGKIREHIAKRRAERRARERAQE